MLDLEVWSDRWMVALVVIALVVIAAGLSFSAIPGPVWHIPLIGDMVDFVVDPPAFFFKRIRKYGNVSRVHLFGRELILIGSPDLLKGPLESSKDTVFGLPISTANELINPYQLYDVHRWTSFRKSMLRSVNPMHLRAGFFPRLMPIMDRATSALFERGTVHNMDAEVRKIVMEAAIVAIAGFSLAPEVIAKIAGLATTVQNGLFAAPIDLPGTKLNKARAARPAYLALWADLARARFGVDPATGCLLSPSAESLVPAGALDPTHGLFHEFAEMGDAATPEKIADRLAQNAVGASETTGNTLLGFYIAISRTPGLMARLRVEQAEVMARLGAESLSYDALLNKMPLLEAALKESQRVLPVSHTIFRRALVDVEVGGFKIKKGQMMLIPPGTFQLLQAHTWDGKTAPPGALPRSYDQRQWEEAYKPERWLVPAAEQPNLHVFGYGPRKCVGMTVANLELRSAMALTLRRGTWVMNNAAVHVKFMPMLSLASGPTSITFTKDPLPGAV